MSPGLWPAAQECGLWAQGQGTAAGPGEEMQWKFVEGQGADRREGGMWYKRGRCSSARTNYSKEMQTPNGPLPLSENIRNANFT